MSKYHPIFDDCKAVKNDGRHILTQVVVWHGWRVATNVRIVVRQPCDEPDTDFLKPFPDVFTLFTGDFNEEPTTLPSTGYVLLPTCEHCDYGMTECGECGQDCDCPVCNGNTRIPPKPLKVVDGYYLADELVAILAKHEAVLYLLKSLDSTKMAKFTIGDMIEGRVMPIVAVDAPQHPPVKSPP